MSEIVAITNINEACVDALQVIKRVCEENGSGKNCSKCPFSQDIMELSSNPYICNVTNTKPYAWRINKNTKFQALL